MKTESPKDPITQIEQAAQSWVGTPFCENSRVKGAGVSCHFGPAEILIEAGLLPRDLLIPTGPPGWSRSQGVSIMEAFLDGDGAKYFQSIDADPWPESPLQPGDLLGFKVGRCVHHLGLRLNGTRMFHVMEGCGAVIAPNIPLMWLKRMTRVWRPKGLL